MTVNDIDDDHWTADDDVIVVMLALSQYVCLSNAEAVCVYTVHLMTCSNSFDHVDLVHAHLAIPILPKTKK